MLPIEPVFDAIALYWLEHYGTTCYPSVALKSEEAAVRSVPSPHIHSPSLSTKRAIAGYLSENVDSPIPVQKSIHKVSVGGERGFANSQSGSASLFLKGCSWESKECDGLIWLLNSSNFFTKLSNEYAVAPCELLDVR